MNILDIAVESSYEPRANCEPPLNPYQPIHNINVPRVTSGIEEAAKGSMFAGSPVLENLPKRGPSKITPASAAAPPHACTIVDPAKSEKPRVASHPPPHCQPI